MQMMKRKHKALADADAKRMARVILQRGMRHNPESAFLAQVRNFECSDLLHHIVAHIRAWRALSK